MASSSFILDNTVSLEDGRKLGYARFGNPEHFPVLFFHGIPGSRLQRPINLEYLDGFGLCLYTIERPGVGLSSPKPDREIADWADDISEFCKIKKFNHIALVGISGGSPYALAVASLQKELVSSCTIISAMPPLCVEENFRHLPFRMRFLFSLVNNAPKASEGIASFFLRLIGPRLDRLFSLLLTHLPESDKILLSHEKSRSLFKNDVMEALRNGSPQLVKEVSLLMSPWQLDLSNIQDNVHIWHGMQDTILPFPLAEQLTARLPRTETHFFPDKGHFFALEEARQIFNTIRKDLEHKNN